MDQGLLYSGKKGFSEDRTEVGMTSYTTERKFA
jgi:hypothetical protein